MSPIVINAQPTNFVPPNKVKDKKLSSQSDLEPSREPPGDEGDIEKAREERKANGRKISFVIFVSLMCLALYHIVQRKTTILAGVSWLSRGIK
jgi:hypothetical protein